MKSTLYRTLLSAFLVLNCFLLSEITAQEAPSEFWKKVRFGGGIGVGFGDGFFSGTLAPSAIYEFNDQFAAGLGLNFTYLSEKDFYNSTILGGSVIALYNVIPQIQLSMEFEQLNENRNYSDDLVWPQDLQPIETNFWYSALFLGAGYRSGVATVGVRYDILYDEDSSIYGTAFMPFVRVYF